MKNDSERRWSFDHGLLLRAKFIFLKIFYFIFLIAFIVVYTVGIILYINIHLFL